jgi:RHS repeat-associated protein
VGNLQSVTYPNGVAHNYSYDTRNRLTNLGVNASTTAIASYAYTLDAAGHRLSVSELSGRTVNYGYDNLYRLTGETIAGDPNGINGAVNYIYDPVGNRKQITSTLAPVPAGLWNYDANDRFTAGDTYDADGNTVSSGGIANVYDFENHLIQKAGVTIVYDGDGNRVSKTVAGVTTSFLVDTLNPTGYAQVVYESFNSSSFGNYELNHSYFYGLELISQTRSYVANFQSATQKIYYAYDGHGSVRALTSPTGSVTDTYDYDAFGNLIRSSTTLSTPTPNNYLFAGEQFDPDLNLYYNRARYLNTSTGRFWTADSADGDVQSPIYLHKYLYAAADPVDLIDPNGFTPLTDFIQKLASRGVDISARAYGSLAHNLIEADIFQKYFPNVLTEISVPGGEIDVVIFSGGNAHLYEIKPVGGTVPPNRQIPRYLAAGAGQFRLPLVAGTLTFSNTIRGPFVIDKITYETAGPGVIMYEPAIDPPNGPLPIPVPIIVVLTALTVTLALVAVLIGSRGPTTAFI